MAANIDEYLADLPELVTPQALAEKLGIETQSIYQRIWRQKQNPSKSLLPPVLPVPGSNKVAFAKTSVIDWWNCASAIKNEPRKSVKSVGRPTKASQIKASSILGES